MNTVLNDFPTWCWKPHNHTFIRLDNTPECDGRTDRQKDRQSIAITAAGNAMRMRCKNVSMHCSLSQTNMLSTDAYNGYD